jgi:transposase
MMSAPENRSVRDVSEALNIPEPTLYLWRKEAQESGDATVGAGKAPERWNAAAKFGVVMEAATLNEAELGRYCRERGLLVEQLKRWRGEIMATLSGKPVDGTEKAADKKRIKELEKELRRKEKALAETAALLVLSRKYEALRMDGEDA